MRYATRVLLNLLHELADASADVLPSVSMHMSRFWTMTITFTRVDLDLLRRASCILPNLQTILSFFNGCQTFIYALLADTWRPIHESYWSDSTSQTIMFRISSTIFYANSSTFVQKSGESLMQYITTARFHGSWPFSLYQGKEKVSQYNNSS
jgi:hypothetical protein